MTFLSQALRRYLVPRKRLGVSLVSLFSILLIALVVWLFLVFFSITEGLEKRWTDKLVDFTPRVRVEPKQAYFSSFAFEIDKFSGKSGYSPLAFEAKMKSESFPYDELSDPAIPERVLLRFQNDPSYQKNPLREIADFLESSELVEKFAPFELGAASLHLWMPEKGAKLSTIAHFVPTDKLSSPPSGPYPILLPISFKEQGVNIDAHVEINILRSSLGGLQEGRIEAYVADFYDPGLLGSALKPILAPKELAELLHRENGAFILQDGRGSGIGITPVKGVDEQKLVDAINSKLKSLGFESLFVAKSYRQIDGVKEILSQIQGDRLLLLLVGGIILLVGSSNIISMMLLLTHEKRAELALFAALGAKKRSLVAIFILIGALVGVIAALIAALGAALTLAFLPQMLELFSSLFAATPMPESFYQDQIFSLSLSGLALSFIATPLLAMVATLFPALRALSKRPAHVLRSDG